MSTFSISWYILFYFRLTTKGIACWFTKSPPSMSLPSQLPMSLSATLPRRPMSCHLRWMHWQHVYSKVVRSGMKTCLMIWLHWSLCNSLMASLVPCNAEEQWYWHKRHECLFQVGDIVSVIDMPPKEDTTWWRGKHGFQVCFFCPYSYPSVMSREQEFPHVILLTPDWGSDPQVFFFCVYEQISWAGSIILWLCFICRTCSLDTSTLNVLRATWESDFPDHNSKNNHLLVFTADAILQKRDQKD